MDRQSASTYKADWFRDEAQTRTYVSLTWFGRYFLLALFFEDDVLSNNRVVLAKLDPVARVGLVFASAVGVARTSGRLQSDHGTLVAFSHGGASRSSCLSPPLDLLAAATDLSQHRLDSAFVDGLDAFGANGQSYPPFFVWHEEPLLLNVRLKPAPGLAM